jgi:hypothetical protein
LRLKQALKTLRTEYSSITASELPGRYMLTSGTTVAFVRAEKLADEIPALGRTAILLDVETLRQEVLDGIEARQRR